MDRRLHGKRLLFGGKSPYGVFGEGQAALELVDSFFNGMDVGIFLKGGRLSLVHPRFSRCREVGVLLDSGQNDILEGEFERCRRCGWCDGGAILRFQGNVLKYNNLGVAGRSARIEQIGSRIIGGKRQNGD